MYYRRLLRRCSLNFTIWCLVSHWGKILSRSIRDIYFTVLTVFRFLRFLGRFMIVTFRSLLMMTAFIVVGILVPLATKVRQRCDEITLSWFLEGSSFNPACLVISVTRSTEVNWTALAPLDTGFHISGRLGRYWPCLHIVQRRCVSVPLTPCPHIAKTVPTLVFCFAVDCLRLHPTEDACAKTLRSVGIPGSASGAVARDLRQYKIAPYPDDENDDD